MELSYLVCAIAAILLHGAGHMLAAALVGTRFGRLRISATGLRLVTERSFASYRAEAVTALGGPLLNLVSAWGAHALLGECLGEGDGKQSKGLLIRSFADKFSEGRVDRFFVLEISEKQMRQRAAERLILRLIQQVIEGGTVVFYCDHRLDCTAEDRLFGAARLSHSSPRYLPGTR